MSATTREIDSPVSLEENQVIDFLRQHPDFFLAHSKLLSELSLPHESGQAVSLIEHQVALLRERNTKMRRRMNDLVTEARTNDNLFAKTRSLTLALLDTETLAELNEELATHVLVDFDADFVCCHVTDHSVSLDHIHSHETALPFAHLLGEHAAVCTSLRAEELSSVFPMSDHHDTGSAVLLPLGLSDRQGALCVGSRVASHFNPDMDTLFVTYIADVLTKVLTRLGL